MCLGPRFSQPGSSFRHNCSSSHLKFFETCCCSITKSCPTLCDPMDCSMSCFSVLHYLLQFAQTHVHWVSDAIPPSHPLPFHHLILCHSLLLLPSVFTSIRIFSNESALTSVGQSIGASVLLMHIQGWFPLGLTGLISLLSKEFSPTPQFKSIRPLVEY